MEVVRKPAGGFVVDAGGCEDDGLGHMVRLT